MVASKKSIVIIFILIILIGALFLLIINPSFLEIKTLAEKVKTEKENAENSYQKGKTLTQLKKEYKEFEDKKAILENIFMVDGKELEFITSLENIANLYKIQENISLSDKINFKSNYKLMPIHLTLRGNFNDLVKYFNEIEHLNFYLNTESLNINTLDINTGQIEVSLDAKTYWQKNPYEN